MVTFSQPTVPVSLEDREVSPAAVDNKKRLDQVLAREKVIKSEWLDHTKEIYEIYEGTKSAETPFNILYSNTEIIVPNVFSSTPTPVVRRRFGDMRADEASLAAERMVEYAMDTNLSGYPEFVDTIESTVLDAALPGQGQTRVRLVGGKSCIDYVQHDQFIWGYAKRWEDVPWVAYRTDKTLEDLYAEFEVPPEVQAEVTRPTDDNSDNKDKGPATVALYEVWDKRSRTVYFLCEAFPDTLVQEQSDPLGISGFFPSGKPLRLLFTPLSTMPKPLYGLYKQQARELNDVTRRIKRITEAIRVRGLYDGGLAEMENIFSSTDNENALVPITSPGAMLRDGGLEKHIWLVPVDKLIVVLQQLFAIREQIKSTIYEILGIGDILRGVSKASETASAQQIKDKWGSLRVKRARERVSQFVRWQIRALIEVSAKHMNEDVWAKITGLPYVTTMQAMMFQQAGQQPPGKLWSQVLQTLQDDLTRSYTIDIETNSTVDADATEDKEEVTEFMTALGQAIPAVQGLASQGPEGHAAAQSLLISISKRFRMGQEFEKALLSMKPQPQGPTEEQKAEGERLATEQKTLETEKSKAVQVKEQIRAQYEQTKQQIDQATEALRNQNSVIEKQAVQLKEQALELERRAMEIQAEAQALKLAQQELAVREAAHANETTSATREVELKAREADLGLREKGVAHSANVVKFEGKQAETVKKTVDEGTAGLDGFIELLKEQSETIQKLVETLNKPVIIQKTGPGKFEKSLGS